MADSAQGLIRSFLDRYGLGSLGTWAWNQYLAGNSIEEIMLEMRTRREYQTRFPAMEELAKAGRAITEEEYISYEQGLRQLVQRFGLPQEIYGARDYIADLLIKDVSLAEAQTRMELAQTAATTIPTEYRMALSQFYGVGSGQLTSYWLEPDRTLPMLERQFAAATVAGETTMAQLGPLSRSTAERLVDAGITREQARQGLSRASYELSVRLPGEVELGLGTDRTVAGALGVGPDAAEFNRRLRQRIAAFQSGTGFYTSERGAALTSTRR